MKKVRILVLVLGFTTIASTSARPAAAADIDGGQVLIAAGIGAVIGGIIGLVKVLSTPKRTAATTAPQGSPTLTALRLAPVATLETPVPTVGPHAWARGVVLTF